MHRWLLQSQHDELEAQFIEEKKALEAKYQTLYQPLYTKVYIPLHYHFCMRYMNAESDVAWITIFVLYFCN